MTGCTVGERPPPYLGDLPGRAAFCHTAGNTSQLVLAATGGEQVFSAGYDTIDQTQRRTITETSTAPPR
ncbi:hypothetical protein P3102_07305 [Amycolatopsis sp. QT-25]|uniref:hypothetical protein n=1 Tax=Amycolatopsis sp. QT-25 TaxID=3034022 RepID=UPI0023EAC007|nr:hypothetical protein [Amycolatopsis sp. QT-25]WET81032.1 hypothetical protein P3102_07305 [Amycolatopsis sp. QT-25]